MKAKSSLFFHPREEQSPELRLTWIHIVSRISRNAFRVAVSSFSRTLRARNPRTLGRIEFLMDPTPCVPNSFVSDHATPCASNKRVESLARDTRDTRKRRGRRFARQLALFLYLVRGDLRAGRTEYRGLPKLADSPVCLRNRMSRSSGRGPGTAWFTRDRSKRRITLSIRRQASGSWYTFAGSLFGIVINRSLLMGCREQRDYRASVCSNFRRINKSTSV